MLGQPDRVGNHRPSRPGRGQFDGQSARCRGKDPRVNRDRRQRLQSVGGCVDTCFNADGIGRRIVLLEEDTIGIVGALAASRNHESSSTANGDIGLPLRAPCCRIDEKFVRLRCTVGRILPRKKTDIPFFIVIDNIDAVVIIMTLLNRLPDISATDFG